MTEQLTRKRPALKGFWTCGQCKTTLPGFLLATGSFLPWSESDKPEERRKYGCTQCRHPRGTFEGGEI